VCCAVLEGLLLLVRRLVGETSSCPAQLKGFPEDPLYGGWCVGLCWAKSQPQGHLGLVKANIPERRFLCLVLNCGLSWSGGSFVIVAGANRIHVLVHPLGPSGPLSCECAQHRPTPRPSVERIRRQALFQISRFQPSNADGSR